MKWILVILLSVPFYLSAQERDEIKVDSTEVTALPFTVDVTLDSKNPIRASIYSAVLPGLGQYYNERYWKIPIVLGAIGTGIGFTLYFDKIKNKYADAFIAEINGEENPYSFLGPTRLANVRDDWNRKKNYAIVVTALVYALNIIDATVDAHLFEIKNDTDLSVEPVALNDPQTGDTSIGLALKLNLR